MESDAFRAFARCAICARGWAGKRERRCRMAGPSGEEGMAVVVVEMMATNSSFKRAGESR